MTRTLQAGLLTVALSSMLLPSLGCEGECEFAIIPKNQTCGASCATLDRADIDEGVICAENDCSLETPCQSGFVCVAVGKAVCLPACDGDDDCDGGLVCVEQADAVTGDATKSCFFDG